MQRSARPRSTASPQTHQAISGPWESAREQFLRRTAVRGPFWSVSTWLARKRPYLQLIARTVQLPGDVVECGVFRGRSLLRLAVYLKRLGCHKSIHGLDSFEGFPSETVTTGDLGPRRTMTKVLGRFKNTGGARQRIEQVAENLNLNIHLHAGYFEQTLPGLLAGGRKFCFVHLDCDIYESYRTCLHQLYDRVVPGGIVLFDEYACPVWPGATRAVDEFFEDRAEKPILCSDPARPEKPKYYVVKAAGAEQRQVA